VYEVMNLRVDWDVDHKSEHAFSMWAEKAEKLAHDWNCTHAPPRVNSLCTVAKFRRDTQWAKYLCFKEWLLSRAGGQVTGLYHFVERRYEQLDVLGAELLGVGTPGSQCLHMANGYDCFEYGPPCPECGYCAANQARPVWVTRAGPKHFYGVYQDRPAWLETLADVKGYYPAYGSPELWLISDAVKGVLEGVGATGCQFEPVLAGKRRQQTARLWQWVPTTDVGPPLKAKGESDYGRLTPCSGCNRSQDPYCGSTEWQAGTETWCEGQDLRFPRSSYTGEDVCSWSTPDWSGLKLVLITQRVHRALLQEGIREHAPEPVFLL